MTSATSKSCSQPRNLGVVAAWSALALVLGCVCFFAARAEAAAPQSCEPISFAVEGSPPPFVGAELELAMKEIHARTGFVFEPASESAGSSAPKLVVSWVVDETPRPGSALVVEGGGTAGRLGYGAGLWRVADGRQFLKGSVEINGKVDWARGLDASDGLAAVFVHELGHVIGLSHNEDPASFMHDKVTDGIPSWTEADAAQMAEFGRQAACGSSGASGS